MASGTDRAPTLAERVLEAYGGAERWRAAQTIEFTVSIRSLIPRLKRNRRYPGLECTAEAHAPRIRIRHFEERDLVAILDGHDVRIETMSGDLVEARPDVRERLLGGRARSAWDRLGMAYFLGYSVWNYYAFPALLLRDDIEWRECSASTLEGRFPPQLPTHCAVQTFHFDPETALLKRHDYAPEVLSDKAYAANLILEHSTQEGIPYTSKRSVKAASPKPPHTPLPYPRMIRLGVSDYSLV